MTVGELLRRIDSRELNAWAAYERVAGPLGPERADIHAGIIASTIANAYRGKRGRRYTPADFIPKWDDLPRRSPADQDPHDHLRLVRALHRAMGGIERRGDGGDPAGPTGQDRRG